MYRLDIMKQLKMLLKDMPSLEEQTAHFRVAGRYYQTESKCNCGRGQQCPSWVFLSVPRMHRQCHPFRGRHVLFLELGVGGNTPVIIKYPFWQMTQNSTDAFAPREIASRSICINADICTVLEKLKRPA